VLFRSRIISLLPEIYDEVIIEFAEKHALGETLNEIAYLIETNNEAFKKQVLYFKTLQNVIKKLERKKLKSELPRMYDRLIFELEEDTIEAALKKKSREELRAKFKQWDKQIIEQEQEAEFNLANANKQYSEYNSPTGRKQRSKLIPLNYIKYAVAAIIVISLGFWYFNKPTKTTDFTLPTESLAEISKNSNYVSVIENKGLGFGTKSETITLVENLQKNLIKSILETIENYKQLGESDANYFNKIQALEKEFNFLKDRENKYIFNRATINVYVSDENHSFSIIKLDSLYYLIKNNQPYYLKPSEELQLYEKVEDSVIINQIDELLFKNGLPPIQN
jgi:hypothetical protein